MNILCILRVQQHSFSLSSCGCLSYSQSPLIKTLRGPEKVSVGVHIKRGEFRENVRVFFPQGQRKPFVIMRCPYKVEFDCCSSWNYVSSTIACIVVIICKFYCFQINYDFLTSADDPAASNEEGKQRYSIGLHLSSLKLHLTLNVEDKCETEKWNGLKGRSKMLFKSEASLNCIVIPVRIHSEENV